MCGFIAAAMAATAVIGAVQQTQQGEYQEDIAKQNAKLAEQQGQRQREVGARDAENKRMQVDQLIGRQQNQFAASGIDTSTGSALDIFADTATQGEFDAQTIDYNAQFAGYQGNQQASQYRTAGKNQRNAANQRAATSLLTAGVNSYGSYAGGSGASGGKFQGNYSGAGLYG